MAVVNTPFPMVFRKADKSYYLMGNDTWYRATAVTDKWEEIADPPQAVMQVRPPDTEVMQVRPETQDTENPSEIDSDLRIIGATDRPLTALRETVRPNRHIPSPGRRGIVLPVGADRPAAAPCSFPVTATCTTGSPAARVGA
jgi:hypothetical protein